MRKLDIYGGLLGAGKTTLIRQMLTGAYQGYQVAIIENEIGKVNLDAQEFTDIQVRPLTSGCVCCTLRGNMVAAVKELLQTVDPDYIIIEATGAADLQAIKEICDQIEEVFLNRCIMLVNAKKIQKLLKVVGEFYYMQLKQAETIYLNFTENLTQAEVLETVHFLRGINEEAQIVSVPMGEITKDTFPERRDPASENAEKTAESAVEKRRFSKRKYQLEVKDVRDVEGVKDPRLILEKPPRIRPGTQKETLYTWTYEVRKPFTEEELKAFWEDVKSREIWRVKGIVSMADGTTRKLDYAFGDIFEKTQETEDSSVLNKIVLIGKR
jgi:G3E family GTPase